LPPLPAELPSVVPAALPPASLPPEPVELPPVPPAALPPVPVLEPPMTPVMQALKGEQSIIARHVRYAVSVSDRAALDIEFSEVLIRSLHWAALTPDRAPHASAFRQTSPATSGPPPPPQPAIPATPSRATSKAAAAGHEILRTVDSSNA